MLAIRKQHVVHLLIRKLDNGVQRYFVYPRAGWSSPLGNNYLTLPAKRTVQDPLAPFIHGTDLDRFVDAILQNELNLHDEDYVLEQELPPVTAQLASPVHHEPTEYGPDRRVVPGVRRDR